MVLYLKIKNIDSSQLNYIISKYLLIYLNKIKSPRLSRENYDILKNAFLNLKVTPTYIGISNIFSIEFNPCLDISKLKLINYGNLEQPGTNIITNSFNWIKNNINNILFIEKTLKMKRR